MIVDKTAMGDDGGEQPAMQVIILGSGGGPLESNTTAFLARSTSEGWNKGSVLAVDAGIHLSGIASILEEHQRLSGSEKVDDKYVITSGPFKGLELPYKCPKANAGHVVKTIVDTYLITHPHLDHISGLVVNTAALPGTRPKRIAALPSTIHAFKQHIFNNVIWPNLSDENDGAGLVTYMRLVEGGSPVHGLGTGEGKGYVEICEGLSVKVWSVSHGHCMENHWHRGSSVGLHGPPAPAAAFAQEQFEGSPRRRMSSNPHALSLAPSLPGYQSPRYYPSHQPTGDNVCVYDSSAYFIRDIKTGREVLIFGDVEPDSISLSPRNHQVWLDAAPKVAGGLLRAIFIECSYDERQSDDTLFGHLCPRFLMEELQALARQVASARLAKRAGAALGSDEKRKRKRVSGAMIRTPGTGTPAWSRDPSPLGARVETVPDGTYSIPASGMTTPDLVHGGSSAMQSITSHFSETTHATVGHGTRRQEMKRIARHGRKSSSVSPHSRPMRDGHTLNGLSLDIYELDEQAAEEAQIAKKMSIEEEKEEDLTPTIIEPKHAHSNPLPHIAPVVAIESHAHADTHPQHAPAKPTHHASLPTNAQGIGHQPQPPYESTPYFADRTSTSPSHSNFSTPDASAASGVADGTHSPHLRIDMPSRRPSTHGMLKGLKVVIIHVKERLDDEEPAGERILRELRAFEDEEGLGVEFVLAEKGLSVFV